MASQVAAGAANTSKGPGNVPSSQPSPADIEERMKRNIEAKLNQFVADQILVDQVETGFNLFLKHRPDLKQANHETAEAEFFKILDTVQPKYLDEAAKFYIKSTGKLTNACVLKRVFAFLQSAVNKHKIEPRAVCDAVLKSEHLTYENSALWIVSFQLVRQIVGGVDYKGVREIMKLCIEKALGLPVNIDKSIAPQLDALKDVLEYIFNRNASLLPGYFIVNEILKSYPDTSHWPHWSLVPLVSKFVDSFRPAAAIVSCVNLQHLFPVVEYLGRANVMSTWKLEHSTLKFLLKMTLNTTTYDRILPYSKEYFKPQPRFLRHLLTQNYSRDLINHVLSLKKPTKETPTPGVCLPLQGQVVYCLLELMRACEFDLYPQQLINQLFRLLSSKMIFFVLYQYVTFPNIISELADGIQNENLSKGRDKLMLLLLQFISGSIQKNPPQDFVEVLRLFAMYSETMPLPVPTTDSPDCIEQLAAAGIYIHIKKKALADKTSFGFRLPVALLKHLEFLENAAQHPVSLDPQGTSYIVPLLCNSFSTTTDLFQAPMLALIEAVGGSSQQGGGGGHNGTTPMPGVHVVAALPVQPLHMDILDSLSVHSKMSLLHHIVSHFVKMATSKSNIAISPGMVETYSRLLVYSELETLGIKSFLDKVITKVFQCQAWGYLYTLLEIFSYRVHHVQAHFRLSLLTTLHQMASHIPNHAQLTLMLESSALRLITGMGNYEMNSPKPPPGTTAKPNYTLYGDSEELNRVVLLTLARTVHIGGLDNNSIPWLKEVVTGIMQSTPLTLPSHTLKHFPQTLLDLVNDMPPVRDTASQIKRNVDEDWNLWNQLTNEQEKINHFSQTNTNSTFLCLLWKMIMESDESARNIPVAAYKVLERTGAKQLAAHLRTFCDYLVLEFSKSSGGGHVTKAIDATNTMIWKYNVITLDRFVLSMVLRTHEGNEAQVCFFIIQVLLLKPAEFRARVNEVCRTMNPDHHSQQNWHEKHMEIHKKFPEQFSLELSSEESQSISQPTLPTYYGNVCLRFLPVFDVVVHRYIELPPVQKSLETLFTHLGCLFKFHDAPITYLYNTFFYYEASLRTRPSLRQHIATLVDQALKEVRPPNWAFSQEITSNYICPEEERKGPDGEEKIWKATPEYFHHLVGRMVGAMDTKVQAFPTMDWRFSEFPNEGAHGLYVTCVELMILNMDPVAVGERLVDVILENSCHIPGDKLPEWINSVGIILSYLPPVYWDGLHNRVLSLLQSDLMTQWNEVTGGNISPMQMFDFAHVDSLKMDTRAAYLLAVVHATWQHAGFNQLCGILELLRDRIKPIVTTEEQLMFVLHMVGPFLQRLYTDKIMKVLFNVTIQLYELILRVDQSQPHLKYMDTMCDLLYHIKYQFTGDSVKGDAERVVKELRPALQLRLRFIAQVPINKTE